MAETGESGANLYAEAIRRYHFDAVFHAEVYMAVDVLDQEVKPHLSETEREVATRAAAIALTLHNGGCTGAGDCPAALHIHGCYADRGACDAPTEHGSQFGGDTHE